MAGKEIYHKVKDKVTRNGKEADCCFFRLWQPFPPADRLSLGFGVWSVRFILFRKFPFWSSHQDMQCIDSRGDCLDCLEIFF